jgi:hypothetical protein
MRGFGELFGLQADRQSGPVPQETSDEAQAPVPDTPASGAETSSAKLLPDASGAMADGFGSPSAGSLVDPGSAPTSPGQDPGLGAQAAPGGTAFEVAPERCPRHGREAGALASAPSHGEERMDNDQQYEGLRLTPSIAMEHIERLLWSNSRLFPRKEILETVASAHARLGGAPATDLKESIKSALANLVESGRIVRRAVGFYSRPNAGAETTTGRTDLLEARERPDDDAPDDLLIERSIGEGSELVYVYFNHAERRLAELEGRDCWPCKVGFTARDLRTRINAQGAGTSMHRYPCFGLVIRSDDACSLERSLHHALAAANCRIEGPFGNEWFLTSPDRIVEWYDAHRACLGKLARDAASAADPSDTNA